MLLFLAAVQFFPPLRFSGSVSAAQRLSSCFAFHTGHIALLPLDKQNHTSADAVSTSGSLKTELTTPPNGCSDDNSAALKEGDCEGQRSGPQMPAGISEMFIGKYQKSGIFFFFEHSFQRREVEVGRTLRTFWWCRVVAPKAFWTRWDFFF